uniref:Uncharacterized protein n=1 Tax=Pristionchus pacificus TaxID=54126 RepID=A0A2A6C5R7_PRIPA|eukprot:PDM73489.1 hypothetical protein PRIPAC_40845 [Pristionchus pacificus]
MDRQARWPLQLENKELAWLIDIMSKPSFELIRGTRNEKEALVNTKPIRAHEQRGTRTVNQIAKEGTGV